MRIEHPKRILQNTFSSLGKLNFSATARPRSRSSSVRVLISAMAAEAVENLSSPDAAVDEDLKFGFQRPEMFKSNLSGTVDPYDRHLFLCYKSYESWPAKIEISDSDPLPQLLFGALKTRKDDISVKTRLTICEGGEGTEFSDGDILIFPEMVKYRGLKESDVDSFVEDVLVNGKPWASGVEEALTGSHVFVCAHTSRDKRCGVCGPVLIEKFTEEIELKGLKDQVFVRACSHVGGHKYAGNLIIFAADSEGKTAGHWYGYVAPGDVPELLDQHIAKGEIIERLWRGQMGVYEEKAEKQEIPNGKITTEELKETPKEEKQETIPNGKITEEVKETPKDDISCIQNNKEEASSCCQEGASGFTCCRDASSETKETTATPVEAKKGPGCKLSAWAGNLEQSDVLAAVGVVAAVSTVAVAYSFYKRSG